MSRGDAERKRRGRLSRSGDFERVYRDGKAHSNRYVIVYAFPRPEGESDAQRLGISVGRNVGGAVERNRVKRALREGFRPLAERLPEGYDFVIVARRDLWGLVEREGTDGARTCLEEVIQESGLARRIV